MRGESAFYPRFSLSQFRPSGMRDMVSPFLRSFAVMTVVLAVLFAASAAVARPSATGMRVGNHDKGVTRLVIDLSESIRFTTGLYADPYRVVINTPGMAWGAGSLQPSGVVQSLRYNEDGFGGRLVLSLKEPATIKSSFLLAPREGAGWRFVVDLQPVSRATFLQAVTRLKTDETPAAAPATPVLAPPPPPPPTLPVPAKVETAPAPPSAGVEIATKVAPPSPQLPIASPPLQIKAARRGAEGPVLSSPMPPPLEVAATLPAPSPSRKTPNKPIVVIDPGHGGVDPGATGVSGIYEKYLTLAMARELKEALEKNGRYTVYLTRDRDVFIRLRDRIAISRQYNADLFISVHADSVDDPQLKGFSVYTLSKTSSDAEAQALADKENKADLISGIDLSDKTAEVANILIDLTQRETMNRSAGFAGTVVEEIGRETSYLSNAHRFAGFAVLKAPDVPSILVEMGYLSNEAEERQLRLPEYRAKVAKGLVRAVDRFFLREQRARGN